MAPAISIFVVSLAGIIALFSFRAWEERRGRHVAPITRQRLDAYARMLKRIMVMGEETLARLPSFGTFLTLKFLSFVSVRLARLSRAASEAAHRLADFISHKHNFERREIRSEFLKTVIEHKNGLAQPIVTAVKKRRTRKAVPKPVGSAVVGEEVQP